MIILESLTGLVQQASGLTNRQTTDIFKQLENYLISANNWWILIAFVLVFILIFLTIYVYSSLTLMIVAKRTKTEPAWLAWIPFANWYLQAKIAKKSAWPLWLWLSLFLLVFYFANMILFVIGIIIIIICLITLIIFSYIWQWKICERRGKPGWWAILPLIATGVGFVPLIGIFVEFVGFVWSFVMWGILAWGK